MKPPFLVIDVGNSVLHWGLSLDGKNISKFGGVKHREAGDLPALTGLGKDQAPQVLVASVNPKPMPLLRSAIKKTWGIKDCEIKAGQNWCPESDVDFPQEVGVDRLLNARAVKEAQPQGAIVVDHGTALTIDLVQAGGIYSGGVIVPGIMMSSKVLAEKTSLIPRIDFAKPPSVIGKNTVDCVRSGLYFGLAGMVQHLVLLIRQENKAELPVIVTGGDAEFLCHEVNFETLFSPQLTLQGILLAGFDMEFWSI
jgi:type III pantothenate kinase